MAKMNKKARREQAASLKMVERAPEVERPSSSIEEANSKLADFTHKARQVERAKKAESTTLAGLPALPRMPKGPRKPKAGKPCECGCAAMTKGGRFIPGHDARLHAWALRVEKGLIAAKDVPAPHTEAVARLMGAKATAANAVGGAKAATKNRATL